MTRHEQNAAFMAQAIGRITGEPGVVIATSGPGASNLATGLVTATAEGDPVLAIAGQVKRSDLLKLTHQSMDNAALFQPITKYSAEIQDPEINFRSDCQCLSVWLRVQKKARALSVSRKM